MARPAKAKVYQQKQDGTLAIMIPRSIQAELGVTKGTTFLVYSDRRKIVFEPISQFLGDSLREE